MLELARRRDGPRGASAPRAAAGEGERSERRGMRPAEAERGDFVDDGAVGCGCIGVDDVERGRPLAG